MSLVQTPQLSSKGLHKALKCQKVIVLHSADKGQKFNTCSSGHDFDDRVSYKLLEKVHDRLSYLEYQSTQKAVHEFTLTPEVTAVIAVNTSTHC